MIMLARKCRFLTFSFLFLHIPMSNCSCGTLGNEMLTKGNNSMLPNPSGIINTDFPNVALITAEDRE